MTNKWYLFACDSYGHSYFNTFDTKEDLEEDLSENYEDTNSYTIVHGKEYKHEVKVSVVEK